MRAKVVEGLDPFLDLVFRVHTFMRDHRGKSYSVKNLRNRLKLGDQDFHRVHLALQVLEAAGVVMRVSDTRGKRVRYRHTGEALEVSRVVMAMEALRAKRSRKA